MTIKYVGGTTVLVLCTLSYDVKYFVQSFIKISHDKWVFKLFSGHDFHSKITKGYKSVNGVTALVLCTSTDDGLYLYKVS